MTPRPRTQYEVCKERFYKDLDKANLTVTQRTMFLDFLWTQFGPPQQMTLHQIRRATDILQGYVQFRDEMIKEIEG